MSDNDRGNLSSPIDLSGNTIGGISRRDMLKIMGGVAAASGMPDLFAANHSRPGLAIVSRHLQWTDWRDGIDVAKAAGYSGIAWTVRPGAHVEPENVRDELPRIVEATRAAGMSVPMIITQIGNVRAPHVERMLEVFQSLGIRHYRGGAPRYDYSRVFAAQYPEMKASIEELAELNRKYDTKALLHTHSSAGSVGGAGWDLWMLMKDIDPRYIGMNFDIGHIVARTTSGWQDIARAAGAHIGALSLKDVKWVQTDRGSSDEWPWEREFTLPGDGMVDYPRFFEYFRDSGFSGPIEVYHEYMANIPGTSNSFNMLGSNYGSWDLEVSREHFISLLKRDVDFYRNTAAKVGYVI